MGSLKREETVLIHNAGGGVGLAAIDARRAASEGMFAAARRSVNRCADVARDA